MPRTFSHVSTERPADLVARQLRSAIIEGSYGAGDRLPVERDLCEQFGVTRSAVRQALLMLQQQGLVQVRPGSGGGPFVTDQRMGPAVDAFENLFALADVTQEQFLTAKTILEPAIAALAASSADERDLGRLRRNLDECQQALTEGRPLTELVLEFHVLLAEATKNPILALMMTALERIVERLPSAPHYRTEATYWVALVHQHRELLDAIENRSARISAELAARHVQTVWGPAAAAATALLGDARTKETKDPTSG